MRIQTLKLVWLFSFFFFIVAHAADKNDRGAVMEPCRYMPSSISKTTLAGINLAKGMKLSLINEVSNILSGDLSSVPLDFVINLSVVNPNTKKVTLSEFEYILMVDNVEFSRGTVKKAYKLNPSSSRIVPLPVSLDLIKLLKGNRSATAQNMVRNFMGAANRPTHILLQIKPVYRIGKETILSPHIPIGFSFQRK